MAECGHTFLFQVAVLPEELAAEVVAEDAAVVAIPADLVAVEVRQTRQPTIASLWYQGLVSL